MAPSRCFVADDHFLRLAWRFPRGPIGFRPWLNSTLGIRPRLGFTLRRYGAFQRCV